MGINERAIKAVADEKEFESLLNDYKPFIAACAGKLTGKYIDEHDDEMSVAIIAFNEAVRRYRLQEGSFLAYAGQLIRCRLIDQLRKDGRTVKMISLEALTEDYEYVNSNNIRQFDISCKKTSGFEDPVKLEIDELSSNLKAYGFGFMDIVKCSPKSKKTRIACAKSAACVIGNPELLDGLKNSRLLPVQKIEKITGVSRKIVSRHRNYIVSLIEILSGEYVYLAEYLRFVREEV